MSGYGGSLPSYESAIGTRITAAVQGGNMVLVDVWEEHLDEASFHWEQWERALVAPDFTLTETAEREERLLAHLEGLGDAAALSLVLRPAFDSEELSRQSAATYALLSLGGLDESLARFLGASTEARAGIRRALELSEAPGLGAQLREVLKKNDLDAQAHVLEALVFRQEVPREILARFFTHDEPRARMTALRAAMPLPGDAVSRLLPALLDSAHPGIRAAAMEAGLASGVRLAWDACRKAVQRREPGMPEALTLLAIGGADADTALLVELLQSPDLRPDVLWALGFSGRVRAVEGCLEYLAEPSVARLAGEAFSSMTGLRLEGTYALPPRSHPEPSDDPDASLEPKPEDDLPWPHVAAITAWWSEARKRFDKGARYLLGQPFSGAVLVDALESSPMRRRHVLARELAIRTRGKHVIPTRAFSRRQRVALVNARTDCAHMRDVPLIHTLR
ncbi:TIGR02270 family protein [Myxococcus sp. AB036A]|uniref:TIGR02270 family protein n=1 Tax=Myxococcus sp. AB036A TaxID=2562793 RepID=UPI001E2EA0A6|nr:TIGR02270 family protein [Myxococcus sp. AB036A]